MVADCPAQVQAAVDTAVRCNATSGLLDAVKLDLAVGLVVSGQGLGSPPGEIFKNRSRLKSS